MLLAIRELDWSSTLPMYVGTLVSALIVFGVVGGLILGVRYLFRSGRHRRSSES